MIASETDLHAEEVALSAVLNLTSKADQSTLMEGFKQEYFHGAWRKLFGLFQRMYVNRESIDVVSVCINHKEEVERMRLPIPPMEINTLYLRWYEMFSTKAGIDIEKGNVAQQLVDRLAERSETANIRTMAAKIMDACDKGVPPQEIYKGIEKELAGRTTTGAGKRSVLTPKDMAVLMYEATCERMDEKKRKKDTIFTSYKKFNDFTGGMERGDLIILSASSGSGKSAFAINLVRDTAYVGNHPVLYLNSEMSDKQQARRYASMLAQVSHSDIRNGIKADAKGEKQMDAITEACVRFEQSSIYTVTIPDLQLSNVVAEIKRMKELYGVDLAVVDYIGRMDTISNKDVAEWQMMEAAARTLKTVAQEEQIVVLMVAQLSGDGTHLAKGSSMKNEADLWLNLQRFTNEQRIKANEHSMNEIDEVWNTYLEFRKARNVESGKKILMHFHGDTLTFTDDYDKAYEFTQMERQAEAERRANANND